MQWALVINPEAGDIIPGAKGMRKLRWVVSGKGKRAGLRIIYYWHKQEDIIYMLVPYKKSDQSDLTNEQMKALVKYVKGGVL
jgi:mRNA-degrading endonuclease RelE of RelBE toxin-antitoxin system